MPMPTSGPDSRDAYRSRLRRAYYEHRAEHYQEAARRLDVCLWGVVRDAASAPSTPHMRRLVRLAHRVERARDRAIAIGTIMALYASAAPWPDGAPPWPAR